MNKNEFDADFTNDDNQSLPLNNQQPPPSWFSHRHYENTITKCIGKKYSHFLIDQEKLLLRVLLSIFLFITGVSYYSHVEKWTFNECCYFIAVSLSGIGYGHFVPTTGGSRIFTCFFNVFGIMLLASTMTVIVTKFFTPRQNLVVDYFFPASTESGRKTRHKLSSIVLILTTLFFGTLYFSLNEPWGLNSSFYFVIITMTTVGYGDFYASNATNRGFLIFFIIICSICYAGALDNFGFFKTVHYTDLIRDGVIRVSRQDSESGISMDGKNSNSPRDGYMINNNGIQLNERIATNNNNNMNHNDSNSSPSSTPSSTPSITPLLPTSSPSTSSSSSSHGHTTIPATATATAKSQALKAAKADENEFLLDMLIAKNIINKERDIDPILLIYRQQQQQQQQSNRHNNSNNNSDGNHHGSKNHTDNQVYEL